MKVEAVLPFLLAAADARTLHRASRRGLARSGFVHRREVPQEHSHQPFLDTVTQMLNINNPAAIQDPVFALLGNAAAAQGQGQITDTDCLQQAVADQAFTNAKAAGNVDGMVASLVFRALERNSAKVGATTAACTSMQAVNPEIAAIQQHQDAAAPGAAENNKNVEIVLAQQIAVIGGDPNIAMMSGTFAPGDTADPTGKGNACDDANDKAGCIFSQNLLTPATNAADIQTAVAQGAGAQAQAQAGNATESAGSAQASDAAGAQAAADQQAQQQAAEQQAQAAAGNNSADAAAQQAAAQQQAQQQAAADQQAQQQAAAAAAAQQQGQQNQGQQVDLGQCQNAAILYDPARQNQNQIYLPAGDAFQKAGGSNKGGSNSIADVADAICKQLASNLCGAPKNTVDLCNTANQQSKKNKGKDAAVVFNQVLIQQGNTVIQQNTIIANDGKGNVAAQQTQTIKNGNNTQTTTTTVIENNGNNNNNNNNGKGKGKDAKGGKKGGNKMRKF